MAKRVSAGANAAQGYTFEFNPAGDVHPLLREFREQPMSGLDRAQVFEYWQIDLKPDAKVERVLSYVAPPDAPDAAAARLVRRRSPAPSSFSPPAQPSRRARTSTVPPMPASTSSKTSVGTWSKRARIVFSASMTRDNSPPDAVRARGRPS